MDYSSCPLYKLNSKKVLKHLLGVSDNRLFVQTYVSSQISPYIEKTDKPRLIEPPSRDLKAIQRRIKNMLGLIVVPNNVFSGIKGRSYVDNAMIHMSNKPCTLFKIDISAFFPNISRETVYRFFVNDMHCSPDVANILTNLTTVDLDVANISDEESINSFIEQKSITCRKHLISGAPSSQILSYLANHEMFDLMQQVADHNGITMSIYVDDVIFSSNHGISKAFKKHILYLVNKYGFSISNSKVKLYSKSTPKLVTGVVINTNGHLVVKNSIRHRIIKEFVALKNNPGDFHCKMRLSGLLSAARQVDKAIFPSIQRFTDSVIEK